MGVAKHCKYISFSIVDAWLGCDTLRAVQIEEYSQLSLATGLTLWQPPKFKGNLNYEAITSIMAGSRFFKIRLFRWFVIHVLVGLLPVATAIVVPWLFDDQPGVPRAGEFLFFSVMICSIAFGDALELPGELKGKKLFALGLFGVGLLWVLTLYGANVHQNTPCKCVDNIKIFWASGFLAALFSVVGTFMQFAFKKSESDEISTAGSA